jgi:hypothetical protein
MSITYREGNEGRLSVSQMDDNFRYIEEQLAGLTLQNNPILKVVGLFMYQKLSSV